MLPAQMEGREVSPDTEPEDDGEAEDARPPPAVEGARPAATAASSGVLWLYHATLLEV